jgi:hypothetical protein
MIDDLEQHLIFHKGANPIVEIELKCRLLLVEFAG